MILRLGISIILLLLISALSTYAQITGAPDGPMFDDRNQIAGAKGADPAEPTLCVGAIDYSVGCAFGLFSS